MFESVSVESAIVILLGYALISWLSYGWGRKEGVLLGTNSTIFTLLTMGFIATRDGRISGKSEFIPHPDAKPVEDLLQEMGENSKDDRSDRT